jgi:hypothetical protein
MADKRELDDLLDEFYGLFQPDLSWRSLVISWFYFFGCLIFGVDFRKSCPVWLARYVPTWFLSVGRKYIEQFGIIPLREVIILGRDLLISGRPHAPQQFFRSAQAHSNLETIEA